MTTKPDAFLYAGYSHQQEISAKQIREVIRTHSGPRRVNPVVCESCGLGGMIYRVTTRDYRCRKCHHVQPAYPRFAK